MPTVIGRFEGSPTFHVNAGLPSSVVRPSASHTWRLDETSTHTTSVHLCLITRSDSSTHFSPFYIEKATHFHGVILPDKFFYVEDKSGGGRAAQGTDQVLVNIMTGCRCQCFLCLWFMSSCHSASSPFICHDGTSLKAELHQRACNRCGRLSDVSLFLLYAFCCWIFSAGVAKKKKKVIFNIFLISRANGEFKLHTVKALHPKLS